MLVQLYRDNYTTTPLERLNFTLYNGYFNGTNEIPNLGFFQTAEVLETGSTTNLSTLATATNGLFVENPTDTEAMNDNFFINGWTYTPNNTITIESRTINNIRVTSTGNDPTITLGGSRPTINPNNFKYIHVRYKLISGNPTKLDLFYYNNTGQGLSGTRFATFDYTPITLGVWKNAVIDMTNVANWTIANWNIFRLDPMIGGGSTLELEHLVISNSPNPPDYNNKSLKISGFFRAKKTGTYRFFTRSADASFLAIDDEIVVLNGGTHASANQFGNISMIAGRHYKLDIYYGDSGSGQEFSSGYLEPNDNGTTSGSTNINDFITNGAGLTTFYDINPETQPTQTTSNFPLILKDATLQGLFRVSPIALYFNRSNFATSKHDILYIASDDLFNNFNGTYKNYIQIHEKPVANDVERKRFTQFSSDMSFICELNGKIEVRFRRGQFEPNAFRHAMLILDVERIPVEQI